MEEGLISDRRRSVIRTLRVDDDIDAALREEADRTGVSVNVIASQVLRKWTDFNRFVDRYNILQISRQIFFLVIQESSEENLQKIAERSGKKLPSMLFELVSRPVNMDTVSKFYLKQVLSRYEKWYEYESCVKSGSEKFILRHDLGPKWSLFLKEFIHSGLKSCLDVDVKIDIINQTLQFSLQLEPAIQPKL
ncbi:MAG: hypothetical protein JRN52_07125 [Nitrososphaerota archaeon]|nr:hypothetical protein [Nitrososphaerota archaeon]